MTIEKEVLDRLLAGRDPDGVFARSALQDDLKTAQSERTPSSTGISRPSGPRSSKPPRPG